MIKEISTLPKFKRFNTHPQLPSKTLDQRVKAWTENSLFIAVRHYGYFLFFFVKQFFKLDFCELQHSFC